MFGDPKVRIITFKRRSKKRPAVAVDERRGLIRPVPQTRRDLPFDDARNLLEIDLRRVRCTRCGRMKSERLDVLADNPFYTKRFAYYVVRCCRQATIKEVAEG